MFRRRTRIGFTVVASLFLFSGSAPVRLLAETTNLTHSAATDVSVYPSDPNSLPGRGPAQTWSEFPKIWAQRHAEWRRARDQENGAVVFLGDSITQGWSSLKKDFPGLKVANRGIGGDTTRGLLYRLDEDVLSLKPKAVVLLIGTNDIGLGADPDDVAANIRELITGLHHADPAMLVILCNVMPSSETKQRPASKIKKLNSLLAQVASADAHVKLCDTWSIYAGPDGNSKPDEFPDLLHPNAAGYTKWAAALKPLLATVAENAGQR